MYSLYVIFQDRDGKYAGELRIKECSRDTAEDDCSGWSAHVPASLDKFQLDNHYTIAFAEIRDEDGRPVVF